MEERRYRRKAAEFGCWLVEGEEVSCYNLSDISESGAFVATQDPLPVGKVVQLQCYTPHSAHAVQLQAEVVWSRSEPDECGMGIRFLNMDEAKKRALAELLVMMKQESAQSLE